MLAYAAFDVGHNLTALFAGKSDFELLKVVLEEEECVFVDIENLSVDVCGIRAFHCSLDCRLLARRWLTVRLISAQDTLSCSRNWSPSGVME